MNKLTNRTKIINGQRYYLISSGNNKENLHKFALNYKKGGITGIGLGANAVRVVRFNDKEAAYESARYGVYAR